MKKLLVATGVTALVAAIVGLFVHHKKENGRQYLILHHCFSYLW